MKRVLVTGASGFIGRHCLPLLVTRGYEVHAVSLHAINGQSEKGVFWHKADLLGQDEAATLIQNVRPSHLLHLAWYTEHGKYWTSAENLRWVQTTIGLAQAFAECGGDRVVMAGSCAEYDWRYGYCSEKITPAVPNTLYGACKHACHLIVAEFSKLAGLSTAWARIFFLFGPFEQHNRLVAYVIRSLLQDKPANCSHGNQIRDYLYIRDVADALVSLLDSTVCGPINVASGQPTVLRNLIYKIGAKLKKEHLIRFGAVTPPVEEPPFLVADVQRLQEEVGWMPKYDLDTGLEQTIEWWKQQANH